MRRQRIDDITIRLTTRREVTDEGCWLWTGDLNNEGYGMTSPGVAGGTWLVHRICYEREVGPIPDGAVLDHLCRNRRCFNPAHLEPVTNRENVMRSPIALGALNAAKTHCPQGHPYNEANTYVYEQKSPRKCTTRICKTCREAQRQRRIAARMGAVA